MCMVSVLQSIIFIGYWYCTTHKLVLYTVNAYDTYSLPHVTDLNFGTFFLKKMYGINLVGKITCVRKSQS
jgi:hypothetical protein